MNYAKVLDCVIIFIFGLLSVIYIACFFYGLSDNIA